jgi:hypothetical protein
MRLDIEAATCIPPYVIIVQIKYDCLALHGIASRLRHARFKSGALRLNNTRLYFALDTGGNPVSASPYVQTHANFLVEEYMLLANMRVAAIIARAFPKHALLRCAAASADAASLLQSARVAICRMHGLRFRRVKNAWQPLTSIWKEGGFMLLTNMLHHTICVGRSHRHTGLYFDAELFGAPRWVSVAGVTLPPVLARCRSWWQWVRSWGSRWTTERQEPWR